MLLALLGWTALAQSPAELIDGTPEFESCLDNSTCAESFNRFLSNSMAEQGFTFQHDAVLTTPTTGRKDGGRIGVLLTTFPLRPPRENLSGKEENTSFSPVLPRVVGGWTGAVADGVHLGIGGAFLPPVPVQGASALVAGADASLAFEVSERVRIGPELDLTLARARAPIVASEEQYENRDSFDNPSNLDPETYEEVCLPQPNGCVDTFTVVSGAARLTASVDAGSGFVPYAKLGLAFVDQRLWVMYDDTTWRVRGLQPSVHLGSTWSHEKGPVASLGTSLAYKGAAISESGAAGAFFKIQGAVGWSF